MGLNKKEEEILVFGTIQYAKLRKKESGKNAVLPLNRGPSKVSLLSIYAYHCVKKRLSGDCR